MIQHLRTLPLQLFVQAQTAATTGATRVVERAPQSQRGRLEMAGALCLGLAMGEGTALAATKSRDNITKLIANIGNFLTLLVAAGSVVMLAYAALLFVGSGGQQKPIDKAKEAVKNVVIGLAIAAAIWIIRSFVIEIIGSIGGGETDGGSKGENVRRDLLKNGSLSQSSGTR